MKNVMAFNNAELGNIRVCKKGTEIWFVAKDVAEILRYNGTTQMTRILDEDEKSTVSIKDFDTTQYGMSNKVRAIVLINESGLYSVMLRSRKKQAKKFKKWVTSEVLPSIRKHGAYMTDTAIEKGLADGDYFIDLAKKLKAEKQARIAVEQKKLMLEAANLKLQKDNKLLLVENKVLVVDIFSWDVIPAIRKMINRLAIALGDNRKSFGIAWALFYERMYYDYGKNFKSRKGKFEEKFKSEEEVSLGLKVVTALCRENYVDVDDVLGNLKMVN